MPEQPEFQIGALVPDANDGSVPQWCDLVVTVERGSNLNARHQLNLTRAAGEAIIDAIHEVIHPWSGRGMAEVAWRELDFIMARLMDGEAADDDKGRAQGLAYGLACMMNPFTPDVDEVRAEAMERYESQTGQRNLQRTTCEKFGHKVYPSRPEQCATCGHLMAEGDRINGRDESDESPFD